MREEALLYQLKRRWVPTADAQHGPRVYPNLLVGGATGEPELVFTACVRSDRLL
jgi:hypothetical protein